MRDIYYWKGKIALMNRPFWTPARPPELNSCDSVEPLISLYADGVVSADESQRVEAHLPVCESCRASLLWAQATHRALASRPVVMPPAYLRARIAQSLAASPASLAVRPTRAFVLRPAYAAAASLSVLGVVIGYGLLHHSSSLVRSVTSKPNMVAAVPHIGVQIETAPATTMPHHPVRLYRPELPFSPPDAIGSVDSVVPHEDVTDSAQVPIAKPITRIDILVKVPAAPILRNKPVSKDYHLSHIVKKLPRSTPVIQNTPRSNPAPDNTPTVMANNPRPAPSDVPVSLDPVSVLATPQPAPVMTASVEAGGLLGSVREQAARMRAETVKAAQSGIREGGYGMRTAALDESGTAAITEGKY